MISIYKKKLKFFKKNCNGLCNIKNLNLINNINKQQ